VIALLDALNLRVLPRLYPAFHLAMGALALLVGGAAGAALSCFDSARRPRTFSAWLLQGRLLRVAAPKAKRTRRSPSRSRAATPSSWPGATSSS